MEKFMNIWEIEPNFKCPVIGAILPVEKHRSVLKQCGWDVKRLKPWEYHTSLMGCMGDENAVSVKVNNFIRHKARKLMVTVADLYDRNQGEKVETLWKTCAAQGQIGPAMYAIVAHQDADIGLLRNIHGEVHMLSHANMTEVFELRKKRITCDEALAREKLRLNEKNALIRELVDRQKSRGEALDQALSENEQLKKKVQALEARLANDGNAEQQNLNAELRSALDDATCRVRELERAQKQLQIDLFSSQNENGLIRRELETLVTSFACPGPPLSVPENRTAPDTPDCPGRGRCGDQTCPNYTLCARRVFMIGGITKMKSYYREIVERAGGKFDYHDGYMKNANANLTAKVRRCDVVVCPVSCNSHNACLRVKKLCQRYNKELKILNSASLSAVTQALFVPGQEEQIS